MALVLNESAPAGWLSCFRVGGGGRVDGSRDQDPGCSGDAQLLRCFTAVKHSLPGLWFRNTHSRLGWKLGAALPLKSSASREPRDHQRALQDQPVFCLPDAQACHAVPKQVTAGTANLEWALRCCMALLNFDRSLRTGSTL